MMTKITKIMFIVMLVASMNCIAATANKSDSPSVIHGKGNTLMLAKGQYYNDSRDYKHAAAC